MEPSRRGRRGKVEDVVQFSRNVHEVAYVVVVESELWITHEVLQILHISGNEVVHPKHFHAFSDESVT